MASVENTEVKTADVTHTVARNSLNDPQKTFESK